jgi:hypothetical protein
MAGENRYAQRRKSVASPRLSKVVMGRFICTFAPDDKPLFVIFHLPAAVDELRN